jgi:hypothetical protein
MVNPERVFLGHAARIISIKRRKNAFFRRRPNGEEQATLAADF